MAPFVEFDLSAMIHSTTESVRLYGTPVLTGGKLLNMLTVRSGLLAVSCCGLVVPGARNTQLSLGYAVNTREHAGPVRQDPVRASDKHYGSERKIATSMCDDNPRGQ